MVVPPQNRPLQGPESTIDCVKLLYLYLSLFRELPAGHSNRDCKLIEALRVPVPTRLAMQSLITASLEGLFAKEINNVSPCGSVDPPVFWAIEPKVSDAVGCC